MDLAIKLIVLLPMLAAAIAGLFCRVLIEGLECAHQQNHGRLAQL